MTNYAMRPLNDHQLALNTQARRRYEAYARAGKYATFGLVVVFFLVLMKTMSSTGGADFFAALRMRLFVLKILSAVPTISTITIGVWCWFEYKAQDRSPIKENKLHPRWLSIVDGDKYQELKKAQGCVFSFQFEQLKGTKWW